MKSKTLRLIEHRLNLITEQGEDPQMQPMAPDQGGQQMDVQDVTEEPPGGADETMPLTSEGEDKYIKDLVDAALFQPSAEEANSLLNLQSVMELKKFTNAREEVLPIVLGIISKETQANDMRANLDALD